MLVEQTLVLDIDRLVRERLLIEGQRTYGTLRWTNARTGECASAVTYEANMTSWSNGPWLRLRYATYNRIIGRREIDQLVSLATTGPHFGGLRWWFIESGRRVGRLHLPPGGDLIRSRRAYGLVYASQYPRFLGS